MATTHDYINQLKNDKDSLVNNLVEKGVEASIDETFTELVPKVLDIQSSPQKVEEKDINFYDYDGTLLYSYSIEDLPLENLPTTPIHDGLICQGWNWNLQEVNELTQPMNIGTMYVTDTGETRLYIEFSSNENNPKVNIRIQPTVATGVVIDWGDGTTTNTNSTALTLYTHEYSGALKNYVIKIIANSGSYHFGAPANTSAMGDIYYDYRILKKVQLGESVTALKDYSFYRCVNLETITVPINVIQISSYCFQNCFSLKYMVFPAGVTNILTNSFCNCYNLEGVSFSNTIKTGANYIFQGCCLLKNITIPDSFTSINSDAFKNCYNLRKIKFSNSMTNIASSILYGCCMLNEVSLSSQTSNISGSAFYNCYSLEKIEFPDTVSSFGSGLFNSCYSLKEISIPKKISSIPATLLASCTALKAVYFSKHTSVPTLSNVSAFPAITSNTNYKIYVPIDLLNDWKTATNWSSFADIIEPLPEEV